MKPWKAEHHGLVIKSIGLSSICLTAGYIDASTRGVWSLTEKGRSYSLNHEQAVELYKRILKQFVEQRETRKGRSVPKHENENDIKRRQLMSP